ncbi:MAG: hypothetical protein ACUVQ3_06135 [bacterium]
MRFNHRKIKKFMPLFLIILGIAFRLSQYFYNRSLTEGEAPLAMNIIQRSYSALLKPLDYAQAAPVGFLCIEKLCVDIMGNNEFALRIFSLISGILAIFLFSKILQFFDNFKANFFALLYFTINDPLIYFSSEVKPYSSDVFFSLIIILMAIRVIKDYPQSLSLIIPLCLISAFCIWFSFPSVFVFCGIWLVLTLIMLKNKNGKAFSLLMLGGIIWFLSLGINYSISLQHLTKNKGLAEFWQNAFIPLPPKSLSDLYLLLYNLIRVFKNPAGFSIYELLSSILIFFIGIITCWQKNKYYALIFIAPVIITMLGSSLHLYPFEGRLLLFITPVLFVFAGSGISYLYEIIRKNSQFVAILIATILLIHPIGVAFFHLIRPRAPEELRTVLEYVQKHKNNSDIIYVYYGAVNAFRYYQKKFSNIGDNYITGVESRLDWIGYYRDIERLSGNKRVWFLFSHVAKHLGVNEEKLFLSYLNIKGQRIESFTTSGASAYLYDLSE